MVVQIQKRLQNGTKGKWSGRRSMWSQIQFLEHPVHVVWAGTEGHRDWQVQDVTVSISQQASESAYACWLDVFARFWRGSCHRAGQRTPFPFFFSVSLSFLGWTRWRKHAMHDKGSIIYLSLFVHALFTHHSISWPKKLAFPCWVLYFSLHIFFFFARRDSRYKYI